MGRNSEQIQTLEGQRSSASDQLRRTERERVAGVSDRAKGIRITGG